MRFALAPALALIASVAPAQTLAPATATATPGATVLLGTWKVDLRPSPEAEPYFQDFVVSSVRPNNTFEGMFYGTPISEARINTAWGTVRIAFVTADPSGPYHHTAVLQGGRLEGLTHSTGRDFLSYWSAVKPEGAVQAQPRSMPQ